MLILGNVTTFPRMRECSMREGEGRQREGKGTQSEGKERWHLGWGREGIMKGGAAKGDKTLPSNNLFFLTARFSRKQCRRI